MYPWRADDVARVADLYELTMAQTYLHTDKAKVILPDAERHTAAVVPGDWPMMSSPGGTRRWRRANRPSGEPPLQPVMEAGRRLAPLPPLAEIRGTPLIPT